MPLPLTPSIDDTRREQLLSDGFCRFPGVLDASTLTALLAASGRMLAALSAEEQERTRAQGSLLPTTGDPAFADLIARPKALAALAALGFPHPTFTDGYVISKPGGSPRLFWHYDWFAWGDPYSHGPVPPQVFAMYYLSDTTPENGCLRVIPGSHVRHNPLHDLLREPHSHALSRASGAGDATEFSTRPDEVDVPVTAGDLLIGDARLLHAAHANRTMERRTLVTLWYQPDFAGMPEPIQAQMAAKAQQAPADWPETIRAKYTSLLPHYDGHATPSERQLYRCPPDVG